MHHLPRIFRRQLLMWRMPVCLLVFSVSLSLGAPPVRAQFQIPADADQFLQGWLRMTPQEREDLRKVEVPGRIELDYGQRLFLGSQQELQRQGIALSDRNRDARYLQGLVQRLRPRMTNAGRYRRVQVYVVDSPAVDARSVPGGYLLFSRGLLEFAESEAALIGIVGHELSHLDRRHQLKPVQQWLRAQDRLSRPRGADFEAFWGLGQSMMKTFHPFHPDEEQEADQDSVRWMYQLGYDPRELARLFQRLAQREAGAKVVLPGFLQTHPLFPRRSEAVLEQLQTLQREDPKQDLILGREALATRTPDPRIGGP